MSGKLTLEDRAGTIDVASRNIDTEEDACAFRDEVVEHFRAVQSETEERVRREERELLERCRAYLAEDPNDLERYVQLLTDLAARLGRV